MSKNQPFTLFPALPQSELLFPQYPTPNTSHSSTGIIFLWSLWYSVTACWNFSTTSLTSSRSTDLAPVFSAGMPALASIDHFS